MKKNNEKEEIKKTKHIDKSAVFVKGMALFLAAVMVVATCSTLIFAIAFA